MLSNLIEHESLYINKFNSYIRNNIFRDSKDNQLKLDFGEIYSIYENAHKEYGNKAYSVVLKSLGLLTLVNHKDGIENLKKVIEVFHNERTARRHITEINQLISIFKSDVDKINSKSHYFIKANQEIREKLIINQLKAA
jgi:thymidylate synthase